MALGPLTDYGFITLDWLLRRKPIYEVARGLEERLAASRAADVDPDPGESLTTWFDQVVARGSSGDGLRLVVGETRGGHRGERDEWADGKMIRAASSDGAAGSELLLGLLNGRLGDSPRLDYKFLVDEWPETREDVTKSHLIVIGTGEVNFLAAFLQSFLWAVIQVRGLADALVYFTAPDRKEVPREGDPAGTGKLLPQHPGAVLLLKNPWNLKKRLIWVAGLTGRATADGARLVLSPSPEYLHAASSSVGVVYKAGQGRGTTPNLVACRQRTQAGAYDWMPPPN